MYVLNLTFFLLQFYSFNATLMLESLHGKTMLFIGDSLNRGQFISMVCLLHRLIPEDAKSMEATFDSLSVFIAKVINDSDICIVLEIYILVP